MKITSVFLGLVLLCAASIVGAQSSMVPQSCSGKTGDALRNCVREITPAERVQRLEPVETAPDPTQPVNCLKVYPADRNFCIQRNEVITECRNKLKYPDFNQCFAQYMTKATSPKAQDCNRVSPELSSRCIQRNALFEKCMFDPLRYFICVGDSPKK
jgi:hypothetical protein